MVHSGVALILHLMTVLARPGWGAKIWKPNTNALNRQNWVDNPAPCRALIFPPELKVQASLNSITIEELVLPQHGSIVLTEAAHITFEKNPQCIRIKNMGYSDWLDANNWDFGPNRAVPDAEKLPCQYDSVIFPKSGTFAVNYPQVPTAVGNLELNGRNLSDFQWQWFVRTQTGYTQFHLWKTFPSEIRIKNRGCPTRFGCYCHENLPEVLDWACKYQKVADSDCGEPVDVVGNCGPICGAVVTGSLVRDFDLERFKSLIPKYENVDSYASRVNGKGGDLVQTVFVDRGGYDEASLRAAENFHSIISGMGGNVKNARLIRAGPKFDRATFGSALVVMMATLAAACAAFGLIYAIYSKPGYDFKFPNSLKARFLFTRFENRDGGTLTLDGRSIAGSVISLEKAFDNPLYGRPRPSTSSSLDAVLEEATDDAPGGVSFSKLVEDQAEE